MQSLFDCPLVDSSAWQLAWNDAYRDLIVAPTRHSNDHNFLVDFHTYEYRLKGLKVKSITRRGLHLPHAAFMRAEYTGASAFIKRCSKMLAEMRSAEWNQLIIPDVILDDSHTQALDKLARDLGAHVHVLKRETAYRIAAPSLDIYKKSLSTQTRKRYFENAERLSSKGNIRFSLVDFSDAVAVDAFFDRLDECHLERWGKACYSADDKNFLKLLDANLQACREGCIELRGLYVDDRLSAVLVDVVQGRRIYNFQSGFISPSPLPARYPLGSMLLGHAISAALESGREYYLLAGSGKHSDYKKSIATHQDTLVTLALERGVLSCVRRIHNSSKQLFGK